MTTTTICSIVVAWTIAQTHQKSFKCSLLRKRIASITWYGFSGRMDLCALIAGRKVHSGLLNVTCSSAQNAAGSIQFYLTLCFKELTHHFSPGSGLCGTSACKRTATVHWAYRVPLVCRIRRHGFVSISCAMPWHATTRICCRRKLKLMNAM